MIKRALFIFFFLFLLPLPSIANVTVTGDVDGTTTITATENITITKDIDINVTLTADVETATESEVINNQTVSGNNISIQGESSDLPIHSEARIDNTAFTGESKGIININQTPGSINNQSNTVSISAVFNDSESVKTGFIHSQAAVGQNVSGNTIDIKYATIRNIITGDAFKDAMGIIGVNQSAGNMNNQNNSVIVSIGGSVILSDASLGQMSSGNTVTELGVNKYDVISGNAFSGVTGIVSVNQSSGHMNNQSNIVVISVNGVEKIF